MAQRRKNETETSLDLKDNRPITSITATKIYAGAAKNSRIYAPVANPAIVGYSPDIDLLQVMRQDCFMAKTRAYKDGSGDGSEPADLNLYDYHIPQVRRAGGRRKIEWNLVVTDDWPEVIPITEEELDIFERYFGDVLDEIFGSANPADPPKS